MIIEATFTNIYEDGDEVVLHKTLTVAMPGVEVWDEWAEDWLLPETGTGRTEGDAGYFVEVTRADQCPGLVGRKFEWGT